MDAAKNLVALHEGHGGQVSGQVVDEDVKVTLTRCRLAGGQDGDATQRTAAWVVALLQQGQHAPAAGQVCAGQHLGLCEVFVTHWALQVFVGGCR